MKPTILRTRRKNHIETLEARIAPATFTVINLDDSGAGSLRDAVTKANLTPAADTIIFKGGLAGAIGLTSGEMAITAPLSIKGPGAAKLTISGGAVSRIFNISDGDGNKESAVSISGLALVNGFSADSGGAILSTESLSITNCTLAFNRADAGGAVHLQGGVGTKASVTGSIVSGNSATNGYGGGLYLDAIKGVTITKTVVSGNTATGGGGGAYLGIDGNTNPLVKVSVIGSVFTGNTSGNNGGGAAQLVGDGGQIIVTGSTFTGNKSNSRGGALYGYEATVMTVTGSLFVGNESASTGGAIDFYGMKNVVKGSKFIGNKSTAGGGALRFNALSVATNSLDVSASTFSGNSSANDGGGIVAGAGGAVKVSASIFSGNRAISGGGAISTEGSGASATKLTVLGGTFSENSADSGGAIDSMGDGALAISAAKFLHNRTTGNDGGALYLRSNTTISIVGSLFSGNRAADGGGGLVVNGGTFTLTGLTIINNVSESDSGGLGIYGGTGTLSKSLIKGNHAGNDAGGLYNGGTLTIQTTIITGNTAKNSHGGVHIFNPADFIAAATVKIFGNLAPVFPDSN